MSLSDQLDNEWDRLIALKTFTTCAALDAALQEADFDMGQLVKTMADIAKDPKANAKIRMQAADYIFRLSREVMSTPGTGPPLLAGATTSSSVIDVEPELTAASAEVQDVLREIAEETGDHNGQQQPQTPIDPEQSGVDETDPHGSGNERFEQTEREADNPDLAAGWRPPTTPGSTGGLSGAGAEDLDGYGNPGGPP